MLDWRNNYEEMIGNVSADGEMLLRSIPTFSALMGILLSIGFLANAYIIWLTTRCRFLIRLETFRLILRYSSVVELSLCAVLASVVLQPWVSFHAGSDITLTLQCARFHIDNFLLFGACLVGSGVIVITRQVNTLLAFDQEFELFRQHRSRATKLCRDVAVAGVVCVIASVLLKKMAPSIDLPLCFVAVASTSRGVHLLIVPIVVNVAMGVVVISKASRPVIDCERQQGDTWCDTTTLIKQPVVVDHVSAEVSDCRWKRFVVVLNVAVLTWFTVAAAMALAGVLLQSVSVDTLLATTAVSAFTGAWSLYAVVRYWA